MKIAIVGDSHVGALRQGWEALAPEHPDVTLTFFAHRRNGLEDLGFQPGLLVPETYDLRDALMFTSDGLDQVVIDNYDTLLVYGGCATPYFLEPDHRFSSGVLERALRDTVEGRLSFDVVNKAYQAGAKQIYVGHDPLPTELTHKCSPETYTAGLELLNAQIYQPLNAHMVPQAQETIVEGCFTNPEFLKGARRLAIGDQLDSKPQPIDDPYRHMNVEYGRLWLQHFLGYITDRAGHWQAGTKNGKRTGVRLPLSSIRVGQSHIQETRTA